MSQNAELNSMLSSEGKKVKKWIDLYCSLNDPIVRASIVERDGQGTLEVLEKELNDSEKVTSPFDVKNLTKEDQAILIDSMVEALLNFAALFYNRELLAETSHTLRKAIMMIVLVNVIET